MPFVHFCRGHFVGSIATVCASFNHFAWAAPGGEGGGGGGGEGGGRKGNNLFREAAETSVRRTSCDRKKQNHAEKGAGVERAGAGTS